MRRHGPAAAESLEQGYGGGCPRFTSSNKCILRIVYPSLSVQHGQQLRQATCVLVTRNVASAYLGGDGAGAHGLLLNTATQAHKAGVDFFHGCQDGSAVERKTLFFDALAAGDLGIDTCKVQESPLHRGACRDEARTAAEQRCRVPRLQTKRSHQRYLREVFGHLLTDALRGCSHAAFRLNDIRSAAQKIGRHPNAGNNWSSRNDPEGLQVYLSPA